MYVIVPHPIRDHQLINERSDGRREVVRCGTLRQCEDTKTVLEARASGACRDHRTMNEELKNGR